MRRSGGRRRGGRVEGAAVGGRAVELADREAALEEQIAALKVANETLAEESRRLATENKFLTEVKHVGRILAPRHTDYGILKAERARRRIKIRDASAQEIEEFVQKRRVEELKATLAAISDERDAACTEIEAVYQALAATQDEVAEAKAVADKAAIEAAAKAELLRTTLCELTAAQRTFWDNEIAYKGEIDHLRRDLQTATQQVDQLKQEREAALGELQLLRSHCAVGDAVGARWRMAAHDLSVELGVCQAIIRERGDEISRLQAMVAARSCLASRSPASGAASPATTVLSTPVRKGYPERDGYPSSAARSVRSGGLVSPPGLGYPSP
ncbi:MAG TPA: hypothetical protein VJB02_04865 [Coxiellaceae bacterium]|nr:hypothetical protein [Coxiellaceae bacterium]